jgi:outer membrane protein assembly factor BamB
VPPSYATIYRTRPKRRYLAVVLLPILAAAGAAGTLTAVSARSASKTEHTSASGRKAVVRTTKRATPASTAARAINTSFPGLTTFRGNASRSFYGRGPVPRNPVVLWRYPRSGGMCMRSADEHGVETWCGIGWTGQPNVVPRKRGWGWEIRFGAYDGRYHFLDGRTGESVREELVTGDLAKGSATSDPDGYPLYYAGSRDNRLRIVALDRARPTVLWQLDASTSVPRILWNNDWDGAPLVVRDHLLVGGENSWFYVIKLNRGYDRDGKVRVRPRVILRVPGWDEELLRALGDTKVSIESSVAFRKGVAYFANSGGLVQGWDISRVLEGGKRARRVFRFWTGDDTDASIVIDREGYLYVASELERLNARSARVGQLLKLDPRKRKPLVWSLPIREGASARAGGVWATPAIDRGMLYVATNYGDLLGVNRRTGRVLWRIHLAGPTWGSPVVVGGVLLQGDCSGTLHAFDVSRQRARPRELWRVRLGGCIESTPAVLAGTIWIGTRGGGMYAIGDATRAVAGSRGEGSDGLR